MASPSFQGVLFGDLHSLLFDVAALERAAFAQGNMTVDRTFDDDQIQTVILRSRRNHHITDVAGPKICPLRLFGFGVVAGTGQIHRRSQVLLQRIQVARERLIVRGGPLFERGGGLFEIV